ncbi:MAG TPA: LuxR C-terminal-related transcriptional regulator [Paludibacter sp.]|nr:LuxR C-terminal-related transcriptional regulator [Paludibacter sp.]
MNSTVFSNLKVRWQDSDLHVFEELSQNSVVFDDLVQLLQPGKHFIFILNEIQSKFEWISPSFSNIIDYNESELHSLLDKHNIHPDDLDPVLEIERKIQRFINETSPDELHDFKIMYDYRFRKKDGSYIRLLLQQIRVPEKKSSLSHKIIGIVCDISYLKSDGTPSFCILNVKETTTLQPNSLGEDSDFSLNSFSKREREIISLIIGGLSSREIASKLFISIDTVKNHRKNILTKSNCSNSIQLFNKCVHSGWDKLYS